MSQEARVEYLRLQVENISSHQDINNIDCDFQFTKDGFTLRGVGSGRLYRWSEIEEITANKFHLMTTDDVRLDISFSDVELTISEDILGWPLFTERLTKVLPRIPVDWEVKIIETRFAANTTIIYKR